MKIEICIFYVAVALAAEAVDVVGLGKEGAQGLPKHTRGRAMLRTNLCLLVQMNFWGGFWSTMASGDSAKGSL